MRTNIEIDDELMRKAMKASGAPTEDATVEEALQRLIREKERIEGQAAVLKLKGIGEDGALFYEDFAEAVRSRREAR